MQSIEQVEQHFLENEKDAVEVGLHRAGLQLRRQRPEHRHRLRQPEGLERAQVARPARRGRRRARDGRADADQGRVRLRVRAAADARARHRAAASTSTSRTTRASATRRWSPRATSSSARRRRASCWPTSARTARKTRRSSASTIDTEQGGVRSGSRSPTSTTRSSTAWGGQYIDDFVDRGRVKRVYVQADAPFRMVPEDFNRWSVRNEHGRDGAVLGLRHVALGVRLAAPRALQRRRRPSRSTARRRPASAPATRWPRSSDSSRSCRTGIGLEWTGGLLPGARRRARRRRCSTRCRCWSCSCASRRCTRAGRIPTAVLLVVPLGILGAVLATTLRGMERDVYFQVAMLTTVGLSSKNAILIIEFAKENLEQRHGSRRGDDAAPCATACARS